MSKKNILIISICSVIILTTAVGIVASGIFNPVERQLKLGYKLLIEGNYEEAILTFTKAIEIAPKDMLPRVALANAQFAKGDDEGAAKTIGDIPTMDKPTNGYKDNPPEGYTGKWYTLRELIEWFLEYNIQHGRENINNHFIDWFETLGMNVYNRQEAPMSNKEIGTYKEEFEVVLSSNNGNVYYTIDGSEATYQSTKYISPIRVLNKQTVNVNAVNVDKYYVSSKTLKLSYTVNADELSYEEDWRFDNYQEEAPFYEVERKYADNQPTNETRLTGRIKPQEGEQGQLQEWRNGGFESDEPYREYEVLYVNGAKTEKTRYTGKNATVTWKVEGYETTAPYKEYELKYINGQKTAEKRYTGKTKPEISTKSNNLLTENDAITITNQYLKNKYGKLPKYVEFDHMEGNAYVIHAYNITSTGDEAHTATIGWYYVDKTTGSIKSML